MRGHFVATSIAVLGLIACNACGGGSGQKDPLGKEVIIIDGQAGEGVIKRFSATSKPEEEMADGQGELIFEVQHVDRLVNNEVTIEFVPLDGSPSALEAVQGNDPVTVSFAEGQHEIKYDARLVYKHSEVAKYEGEMKGITAHRGRRVKYKVKLEAPVGFLDMRFFNDGADVGAKVRIDVYPATEEEEAERGEALIADYDPREMLAIPAGTYDVRALYAETKSIQQEEWLEDLVVAGGMARLIHEHDFAITLHGFLLHAKNFGEDINDKTTVYFYRPGANVEFAVAVDQGPAGEILSAEPGIYDVRVVYQPSQEPTTWGDLVLQDVVIGKTEEVTQPSGSEDGAADTGDGGESPAADPPPAADGTPATESPEEAAAEEPESMLVEKEVDLQKPLGTIIVKALWVDDDVSDKAVLRAIYAGADKQAASAVLNVTGLSTHVIPAGDYDILISYDESDLRGRLWYDGLHFEHGDVWEQTVQLRQ